MQGTQHYVQAYTARDYTDQGSPACASLLRLALKHESMSQRGRAKPVVPSLRQRHEIDVLLQELVGAYENREDVGSLLPYQELPFPQDSLKSKYVGKASGLVKSDDLVCGTFTDPDSGWNP
jgi:hypothetical protein